MIKKHLFTRVSFVKDLLDNLKHTSVAKLKNCEGGKYFFHNTLLKYVLYNLAYFLFITA